MFELFVEERNRCCWTTAVVRKNCTATYQNDGADKANQQTDNLFSPGLPLNIQMNLIHARGNGGREKGRGGGCRARRAGEETVRRYCYLLSMNL